MTRRHSILTLVALAAAPGPSARQVADELLVVAFGSSRVLRYDGAGDFVDTFIPQSFQVQSPHSIASGPDDNLYLTSTGNNRVRRYDRDGVFIDNFVLGGGLGGPTHAEFGPDGNLYVSSFNTNEILRYDGGSGAFIDAFVTAGSGGLATPEIFAWGPDGHLYVPAGEQARVLRYHGQTGAFIDVFIAPGNGLDDPHDIAFGPLGDCYVAGFDSDDVLRYDGATGAFEGVFVEAGSGGLDGPHGLVFLADGLLYVTSFNTNQVLRYDADGDFVDVFVEAGDGLAGPVHMLFDPEPRVRLQGPIPGTPGSNSTFGVYPSIPVADVPGNVSAFAWGLVNGVLPVCPVAPLNILDLHLLGAASPTKALNEITVPVPAGISGIEVFFQAIEFPTCRPSQMVRFEFP